jgi:hypothetical protein
MRPGAKAAVALFVPLVMACDSDNSATTVASATTSTTAATGTGGSGGSTTSASGGTGGATTTTTSSTGGAPNCTDALAFQLESCATCAKTACCAEIAECSKSFACKDCIEKFGEDACAAAGEPLLDLLACENNDCFEECLTPFTATCEVPGYPDPTQSPSQGSCWVQFDPTVMECNPVTNEPCAVEEHCDINVPETRVRCFPPPDSTELCGEKCPDPETGACKPGLGCAGRWCDGPLCPTGCVKYCCDDSDCGEGHCNHELMPTVLGQANIGMCVN